MKRINPLGIELLSYVYILNSVFYFFSLLLFLSRIMFLGSEASPFFSACVRALPLGLPLLLALRLRKLCFDAWIMALIFHIFFLVNNLTIYLEYLGISPALLRTIGADKFLAYSSTQLSIVALNSLMNLAIAVYLLRKKELFFTRVRRHV